LPKFALFGHFLLLIEPPLAAAQLCPSSPDAEFTRAARLPPSRDAAAFTSAFATQLYAPPPTALLPRLPMRFGAVEQCKRKEECR